MTFSLNYQPVMQARLDSITLRPLVGAYEMSFGLEAMTVPNRDNPYWLVLHGFPVCISLANGRKLQLGTARFDRTIHIEQTPDSLRVANELKLVLQPHQLAAVEDHRNGGNLRFELAALGEGGDRQGHRWPMYDDLSKEVSRSDWILQLRSAGARDILLIEVPMPVTDAPAEQRRMAEHLREAEKMFMEAHYTQCVAACRHIMEAVEGAPSLKQQWTEALKKLSTPEQRKSMTKEEREFAVLAAVLSYTQPAHHPDDVASGTQYFTRIEAKLALSMCASMLAFAVNGGLSFVR